VLSCLAYDDNEYQKIVIVRARAGVDATIGIRLLIAAMQSIVALLLNKSPWFDSSA
jgi:hypothetical protein